MPEPRHSLPRLLVCDLDGTLLNGQGVVTVATMTALLEAVRAGVEVAFATGRRHSFAWEVLSPIGLDGQTVLISSNGAVVRTFSGERLHRTGMPAATALLLCQQLQEFRSSLIFTFERTGPGALVVEDVDTLQRTIPRWVDSNLQEIERVVPLERAFEGGEEPVQAMICGTMRRMEAAMRVLDGPAMGVLRKRISVHRTEYAARDLCIVDLMPSGCSKGAAVARLAAERGIDVAEIAAIGDNMNDADMLCLVGEPIVMQNAAPELLEMAYRDGWAVTGSNDEDGAAEAILSMLRGSLVGGRNPAARDVVSAD
jgi:hydroxymethylpyrimidine pyrophosphatase-like HAD family hydrolase